MGAVVGATEPRAHRPPARADAALDLPHPRRRRPGRHGRSCSAPPSAPGPPRRSSPPRAASPPTPDPGAAAEHLRSCGLGGFDRLKTPDRLYDQRRPSHRQSRPMNKRTSALRPDPRRDRPGRSPSSSSIVAISGALGGSDSNGSGNGKHGGKAAHKTHHKHVPASLRSPERRHPDLDRPPDRRAGRRRSKHSTPKSTRRS